MISQQRYTRGAIAFHWTIAVLIIINLALGLLHDSVAKPLGGEMMSLHKPIGLLGLLLSLGRLGWRLAHSAPPLPAGTPSWEKGLAHVVHWTLYAFMIALPLTGWWFTSAGSRKSPISAFGLFQVPFLPVHVGGGATHQAHVVLGWAMLVLVLFHVAAALRHQLVKRDQVLDRMWPGMAPQ